jgi:competence protein ComEA
MFKKLLTGIIVFIATAGFAFAEVDINKADQAALDGIKGIGPKTSKAILDERKKGGEFKNWTDFEKRVKGIGAKSSMKLSQAGLTIGGQSKPGAPATSKPAMAGAKGAKGQTGDEKKHAMADTKETKK